jgi:dihydroxyacetone kinase
MSLLLQAILAAADAVEAAREPLCALDAAAGDGDHGVTMAIGARNIRRQLETAPDDPAQLLRQTALAMGAVGGAIGPIYARALLAMAAEVAAEPTGQAGSASSLRRCADAAVSAVVAIGGAKAGDKTVLDALLPARDALAAAEASGTSPDVAVREAAQAARVGAEATAGMVATVGRAARLGERSRGQADAGATSLAIILGALAATALAAQTTEEPPAT